MSPERDDKGYLLDFHAWTREVAAEMAADEGLGPLTDDHWKILEVLRAHHAAHGAMPMIRVLCRETGLTLQQIYTLFPKGPAREAARIAGLPRPDSCV